MEVKHGGLQLGQLDGGDAHRPDVTQLVVASVLLHGRHLWCHPAHAHKHTSTHLHIQEVFMELVHNPDTLDRTNCYEAVKRKNLLQEV